MSSYQDDWMGWGHDPAADGAAMAERYADPGYRPDPDVQEATAPFLAGVREDEAARANGHDDEYGPESRTDRGNAERLLRIAGGNCLYCWPWQKWFVWDGKRWKIDDRGRIQKWAKQVSTQILRAAGRLGDADLFKFGKSSANDHRITAAISLARSDCPVLPADLDQHPMLLNVANGTIDLHTGELRPHDKTDLLTKVSPTSYVPDAECPRWDQFLCEVFENDADLIAYVRRLFGTAVTGRVTEHILPIFYGGGSNGKTTLLEAVQHAIGSDYADVVPPDLFVSGGKGQDPTIVADLFGLRLAVAGETEDSHKLNESMVKRITGGDTLKARRMKEDFWSFQPSHTPILCTNHKPTVQGTDHGIWRRLKLIPFNARFDGAAKDANLPQTLRREAEGILAWCVRGCLEWQAGGLNEPSIVANATAEYRQSEDVIDQFIADQCVTGMEQFKVKASLFRRALASYCESEGLDNPSAKSIGQAIVAAGFEKFTSNGTWYGGIALRHSDTTTEAD